MLGNGARVVGSDRAFKGGERSLSARSEGRGAKGWSEEFGSDSVSVHRVDMYDVPSLSQTLDEIGEKERSIDVLVNNAHELGPGTGFNVPEGSLEAATYETWMRNLDREGFTGLRSLPKKSEPR